MRAIRNLRKSITEYFFVSKITVWEGDFVEEFLGRLNIISVNHKWLITEFTENLRRLSQWLFMPGFRKRGLANGVFPFFSENEKEQTEENGKKTEENGRKRKENKEKTEKTEENGRKRKKKGKNRKRHRSGDPFCETPIMGFIQWSGNFREISGKLFRNHEMIRILAFQALRKANLPQTLGQRCPNIATTSVMVLSKTPS